MNTRTFSSTSALRRFARSAKPGLAAGAVAVLALAANAGNISWQGGAASYTNTTDWVGGVVPGPLDNAINDNGTVNAVQINAGNPDWTVGQIRAGNSAGNGAFVQNAQTVTVLGTNYNGPVISEFFTPFRLGIVAADTGVYTLNGGTLNYGTGPFNVGEVGTGTLNINGGAIIGSGRFNVNSGSIAVPNPAVITATAGHGPYLGDFTYFEQGYYAADLSKGLPAAGSTVASIGSPDHTYTLAPSYTANNAVVLDAAVSNATMTLTTPKACSALSFMCGAGNGPANISYTVNHATGTPETGTIVVEDWFFRQNYQTDPRFDLLALAANGRVDGLGANFQITTPVAGYSPYNPPYLWSFDISLVNPDKVVSINLTYASGPGRFTTATFLGVSGQDVPGNPFNPLAITGYNADVVVEAGAPSPRVSSSVMDTVTQTGGTNSINNELWIAQGPTAHAIYNLSNGEIDVTSWTVVGRSGGVGTFNMTGGTINKTGGGNFIVGSGAGDNNTTGYGTFNQSGGTINDANEYWLAENALTTATNNISGSAVLNLNSWLSIGRGGLAEVNFSGGTITKNNNGAFIVGDGGIAYFKQNGGTINTDGELWIGQSGSGTGEFNLSNGVVTLHNWLAVGRESAHGTLNISGGSFTKDGNGNISIAHNSGASGIVNQSGGSFTCSGGELWVGENAAPGFWNISAGSATFGTVHLAQNSDASGTVQLDGGVFTANEITMPSGGTSTLNFNGGTLRAGTDNANFLHGLSAAALQTGGAVIDSQGFNVTIAQNLTDGGGGGLTKNGTGTLILAGVNNYTGPTFVNAGTLIIQSDSTANGNYSVASSAQLGLTVLALNGQLNVASLTLASATPALGFDLGSFGNPTISAPLNVAGTLAVNGTVTVNIKDSLPQDGQFPLITYSTRTGSGSFVTGSLPVGVAASIVDNTANKSIDLHITSVNVPRWDGQAGGNWDIGLTTNWVNIGDGLPTFYGEGNAVLFDDRALGTTAVNLTTTVNPSSVTFNNTNLTYTLNGSGKISGSTGLTKQGSGVATIANTGGNNYSGRTTIAGGVLSVNSLANGGTPSSIGASSASPTNLVLAGGTLSYSGPAVSINRGYSVQTGGGTIDTEGNLTVSGLAAATAGSGFTKTGPATLTYSGVGPNALAGADYLVRNGSVVLDGTAGPQTNIVTGAFSVAGATGAAVTLTNTTLTDNDNAVGNVAGSFGSMTMNGTSVLNVNSWLTLGDSPNSVTTFILNGGTVNVPNGRLFLCSAPGTIATLNINGGVINKNSGDIVCIADGGWNGSGVRTGIVNQVAGTFNISPETQIANTAPATAVYNLHGGAINSSGWFVIGRSGGFGTFNMDGGVLTHTSGGQPAFIVGSGAGNNSVAGLGILNQSAGTINCTSEYWVAENTQTLGTNNISGTATVNVANWVSLGRGGQATVNFSGGTFTKTGGGNFIIGDGGTAYLNQTGGTLSINSELWIGQSGSGVGRYDLSAGTVSVDNWLAVGRAGATGTLNMSGGSLTKVGNSGNHVTIGSGGPGTVNQTGGTISSTQSSTFIGEGGQPGIWNMNGGSAVLSTVFLPINNGANGTLNLNSGTFSATEITSGNAGGTGTLNFNGGTLVAGASTTNFLHGLTSANVQAGGAMIDSGTNVASVAQPLLDGGGAGGLTKIGTGTLYLNGVNTYTGPTLVNAGTLGGTGTIAGPLTVASVATLAPGDSVGTLTVNNNVTLGGTTVMELSKNGGVAASDLLAVSGNLGFGVTLTVVLTGTNALAFNDTFHLFNWGTKSGSFTAVNLPAGYLWDTSQLYVNGTIRVLAVTPPQVNPPKVVGGLLIQTGAGGPPGASYTWLTSTNVAAPLINWTTNVTGVFDSSGSFSNAFPINTSERTRFFRLRTP